MLHDGAWHDDQHGWSDPCGLRLPSSGMNNVDDVLADWAPTFHCGHAQLNRLDRTRTQTTSLKPTGCKRRTELSKE